MRHSFWDRYSDIDSPVHRLSPGIKLLSALILIIFLSLLPYKLLTIPVILIFIFLTVLLFISKIPLPFVIKRVLMIIPVLIPVFLLNFFFTEKGVANSLILTVRSLLSIFVIVLLISVTRFRDILKTLDKWHIPKIIILTLSFMYRYFFLLTDESEKMVRSVNLRSSGESKLRLIRIYAHILGILFIKSYERSDRVYKAMVMRGYNGEGNIL